MRADENSVVGTVGGGAVCTTRTKSPLGVPSMVDAIVYGFAKTEAVNAGFLTDFEVTFSQNLVDVRAG